VQRIRAFFSYSSVDKLLVEQTVALIERPYVSIDFIEVATGDEILGRLKAAIGDCELFVFFASWTSMGSLWVKAEIREAEFREAMGRIKAVSTFAIEPDFDRSHLPFWLNRYHVSTRTAPKTIARELRSTIDTLMREYQSPVYVGRGRDADEIEAALFPQGEPRPPRTVWLYGLPGVGRRTLLRHSAKDLLSIRSVIEIPIRPGDDASTAVLYLATEVGEIASADDMVNCRLHLENLSQIEVAAYFLRLSERALALNEAPALVDEGGLVDDAGRIRTSFAELLAAAADHPSQYLFVVSRRKPFLTPALPQHPELARLQMVSVKPLGLVAIRQMVTRVAEMRSIALNNDQVVAVAEAVAGYPPSVTAAFQLIDSHGIDFVVRDSAGVSAIRTGAMSHYLSSIRLTRCHRQILSLLSMASPLPLPVIESVAASDTFIDDFTLLLNASLVVVDQNGNYGIAQPVADLVGQQYRLPDAGDLMPEVARRLSEYLRGQSAERWAADGAASLIRSFSRAHLMGGGSTHDSDLLVLAGDVISAAKALYEDDNYDRARMLALEGVALRPDEDQAHIILAKALTKLGHHDEALAATDAYWNRCRNAKQFHWLLGFIARCSGNHSLAVSEYSKAAELGLDGIALRRELAMAYRELGQPDKAREHLDRIKNGTGNRYIADLRVQLACDLWDEADARLWLDHLRLVDESPFYLHRASRVESLFGSFPEAHRLAMAAVNSRRHPSFAFISQVVITSIRVGDLRAAEEWLGEMARRFPAAHLDVQRGQKCELECARGQFKQALETWAMLAEKLKPVHVALRRRALKGYVEALPPWSPDRLTLGDELARLDQSLNGIEGAAPVSLDVDLPGGEFDLEVTAPQP
jgi:tetratricopeptide (TPR) repeat protein